MSPYVHNYVGKRFRVRPWNLSDDAPYIINLPEQEGVCVSFDPIQGVGTFRLPDGSHVNLAAERVVLLPEVA